MKYLELEWATVNNSRICRQCACFREVLPEGYSYKLQTHAQDTVGMTFNAHSI